MSKRIRAKQEDLALVHYVSRTSYHIFLVKQCACRLITVSRKEGIFDETLREILLGAVLAHDASKFGYEEMEAYARYWSYLTDEERKDPKEKAVFQEAWKHHYNHNPHHPAYWEHDWDMTDTSVLHMVCDWAAMSIEKGNSLADWVEKELEWCGFTPQQQTTIRAATNLLVPEIDSQWGENLRKACLSLAEPVKR